MLLTRYSQFLPSVHKHNNPSLKRILGSTFLLSELILHPVGIRVAAVHIKLTSPGSRAKLRSSWVPDWNEKLHVLPASVHRLLGCVPHHNPITSHPLHPPQLASSGTTPRSLVHTLQGLVLPRSDDMGMCSVLPRHNYWPTQDRELTWVRRAVKAASEHSEEECQKEPAISDLYSQNSQPQCQQQHANQASIWIPNQMGPFMHRCRLRHKLSSRKESFIHHPETLSVSPLTANFLFNYRRRKGNATLRRWMFAYRIFPL